MTESAWAKLWRSYMRELNAKYGPRTPADLARQKSSKPGPKTLDMTIPNITMHWLRHTFCTLLYLAGVECDDEAQAPEGWTKWVVPGFEYAYVECDDRNVFPEMLNWLEENSLSLAGAVHDFTCPETGKQYMFFPIRRL